MKKEALLNLGLEEEDVKKILCTLSEELKGYIPKSRFDDVNNIKKQLEKDIKERDTQLEMLKNSTGNIDELKKQIETLQTENETSKINYEAQIKQIRRDSIDERLLSESGTRNKKAIKALLEDIDEKDDNKYESLRLEQIKKLQENEDSKFLFEGTQETKFNFKGVNPGESSPIVEKTPRDFTYEDWCNQLEN
ncbi:phage scaffolding protein [Clostridioides sp. ZZV15-6598]|uniref:phage scaffolding protein n=1 Tax=Clostridioides sp. ZZV15-6598 TaxID=2811501 RepID=UPI001D1069D4|nr:phage scaffolding protein [Clostridioides sp. ZZV15-6598]